MAITDDVAMYALGYWAHERHPLRIEKYCLNTKQKKIPCTECSSICPRGISVHEKNPRWLICSNCNLCVTACPTQAIHESGSSFEAIYSLVKADSPTVVLACKRYKGLADLRLECLASVPWEMLATISLKKSLVLKTSPCKDCEHEECLALFKQNINQLKFFFGKEEFKKRILSQLPEGVTHTTGLAKRRAITSAMGVVRKGVEQLVEEDAQEISHYRALLLDTLKSIPEQERPQVHWRTLIEDGQCSACGACAKICPHNAIKIHVPGSRDFAQLRESTDESVPPRLRGKASLEEMEQCGFDEQASVFIHEASACTQCGLCYLSCIEHTLGGWDEVCDNALPALKAHELDVRICGRCRRTYKPQSEDDTRCKPCSRFIKK